MGLFRRRRGGLSFDLLNPAPAPKPTRPSAVAGAEVRGIRWIAPASDPMDGPFRVSGVMHRQDALARVGSGRRLFRLLPDPGNSHDPDAVKVMADDMHIGFVAAKNAARYREVIDRVEARGLQVFVHGQVRKQVNQHASKWVALIDCAYPNDWPV